MRVLSVSDVVVPDLVEEQSPVTPGSIGLIVGCGDLPPEYLARLKAAYDVPLFFVLGNHDIRHHETPHGCTDITGTIVTFGGFPSWGFPDRAGITATRTSIVKRRCGRRSGGSGLRSGG